MSFELNQTNNKDYIQKIQQEIDSLEKQLFSTKNISNNNIKSKKNKALRINKDLSIHVETTISNINDDTILTQQTIFNSNFTSNEKAELYKIIMRERNENAELEKLRLEQNEKYRELKNKYKIMEKNNENLKNELDKANREKEIQRNKIIELQKEIELLRNINKNVKESNNNKENNDNNININDNIED